LRTPDRFRVAVVAGRVPAVVDEFVLDRRVSILLLVLLLIA